MKEVLGTFYYGLKFKYLIIDSDYLLVITI